MEEILVDCMEDEYNVTIQDLHATPHQSLASNVSPDVSFNVSLNTSTSTSPFAWIQSRSSPEVPHKSTGNGTHATSHHPTNLKTPQAGGFVHQSGDIRNGLDAGSGSAVLDVIHTEDGLSRNGRDKPRTGSLEETSRAQNAIMMYSPDIPDTRCGYRVTESNLGGYYTLIDTEESVKCIVSTFLFLIILVAVFLVAILNNPEM